MLDPNSTTQTTPPAGGGESGSEEEDILTAEALMQGVIEARGGVPQAPEGEDPEMTALKERVYQQDVHLTVNNETEALLEVADMSRSDARRIVLARAQNDVVTLYQAVEKVVRKLTEKAQNEADPKNLRVEPANSGSVGEDETPIRSMGDAVQSILQKVKAGAA